MDLNKMKFYSLDNFVSTNEISELRYSKENEIESDDKEVVIDHIQNIIFDLNNDTKVILSTVDLFDYNTTDYINIRNSVFSSGLYNAYANKLAINKIIVQGICVDVYNPQELLGFSMDFNLLKIKFIQGGLTTDTCSMFITLEQLYKEE